MRTIVQRLRQWLGRPAVRIGLLLAAVFIAGATVGIALDRTAMRRSSRFPLLERARGADPSEIVARMQRNLDLDEGQAARVRAVLDRRQPQMRATWTAGRAALLAQLDTTVSELAAILTPEQRRKLRDRLRLGPDHPALEALMKGRRLE